MGRLNFSVAARWKRKRKRRAYLTGQLIVPRFATRFRMNSWQSSCALCRKCKLLSTRAQSITTRPVQETTPCHPVLENCHQPDRMEKLQELIKCLQRNLASQWVAASLTIESTEITCTRSTPKTRQASVCTSQWTQIVPALKTRRS